MVKKGKRLLALLLSIVLVSSIAPMPTFAEDAETAESLFTVTSAKGVTNKEVHVEVRVSENSQIASLGIELLFDSSKLLVTDFAAEELFEKGISAINGNVSDKVIASFASMEPLTDAGTLFSVDFLVTTEEVNEILDLDINVTEITDINGNELTSSSVGGTVEVVDLLYGDLDFNNKITAVDALKILSSTTQELTLTDEEKKAGDVNGDGEVTVSDALSVLYFSAEIIDDFSIYNLETPTNLQIENLGEYEFTVTWDHIKDVLGYNVYFNGELVNIELLTDASVTIGGSNSTDSIAARIHNSIDHNTEYDIQVTAVNSLKESEKSENLTVKTKRAYSMVTFMDWDGTQIGTTVKVLYGQDAIVPNDPVREGYVFIGWDKPTTNIIEDVVITALYEVATYDYTFYDYDGNELYCQNVVHGGTVTPPANPTRTGYTFSGWYTATEGGTQVTDFSGVTAETTVYAQYTINTYMVTFSSNGGSSVSNKTAVYKTTVEQPSNPTRLGYGFGGWYKEKSCSNKWNFSTDVVTGNSTLYAKWIPVTITIDKASLSLNGKGTTGQLTATITGGTDSITWTSSNTNIATVDSNGKVTAVGHGAATIYIKGTSSERRPVCKVTVNIAKDAWVNDAAGLNLRASNTSYSASYKVIPYGAKISVYGSTTTGSDGRTDWIAASYDGYSGYVAAEYISYTEPQKQQNNNSYVSGNTTSSLDSNLTAKLEEVKKKCPNGYYWRGIKGNNLNSSATPYTSNYYGDSCCPQWQTNNGLSYFTHNGKCSADGCCGCGGYFGVSGNYSSATKWSCYGYAFSVAAYVYGKEPKYVGTKNIQAGDVVHLLTGGWGHWIFVTKVFKQNGTTYIEYTDANGFSINEVSYQLNKIKWGATMQLPSNIEIYRP